MGQRLESKTSTKDEILRVALRLVNEKGLLSVSVKEIASKAGVTMATAHNYFPAPTVINITKEIRKIFLSQLKSRILFALQVGRNFNPPLDQLLAVFLATLGTFSEEPEFGGFVLHHPKRIDDKDDEGTVALNEILDQVDLIIEKMRKMGMLSEECKLFPDWQMGRSIFFLIFSLLRFLYFGEFQPAGTEDAIRKEAGLFFLRSVQTFLAEPHRQAIEEKIRFVAGTGH